MSGSEEKTKFQLPAAFDVKATPTDVLNVKPLFTLPAGFSPHVPVSAKPKPAAKVARVSLEGKVGSRVDPTNYRGNGHWEWKDEPLASKGYTGFIYVIHDTVNSKLYLGKKQFVGAGKLNKGVDSNWRWYISSSKELSESIKANGKDSFRFIAIEQYKSKGALSYAETWSLLFAQTPVYRHKWYNVLINKISWTVREPPTQRHKMNLRAIMDEVNAPHDFSKEEEI